MKPTSDSMIRPAPPTVPRRSFIWKAGAALSATLASAGAAATAPAGTSKEELARLSNQLGMLEDTNAIRRLHRAYGDALNNRLHENLVNLFADDSEVHFNGNLFVGKDTGIRRLYVEHFGQRLAAYRHEPIHVFLLDQTRPEDLVEVAADRKSAQARFHCLVQAQAAVASNLPIMEMARQQGQGILHWWESGLYENAYVKEGEVWKIQRLGYRAIGPADPARWDPRAPA
jgi:SnoaL-like domain